MKELRAELRATAKEHVLDGGKPEGISGGSMADAYDEAQQQEMRDLRTRIEKQDITLEDNRVLIEELRLELQQVYYSFHRPGVREGLRPAAFGPAAEPAQWSDSPAEV